MNIFDTNKVKVSHGTIDGELFVEIKPDTEFINLNWDIRIHLNPLEILGKKYENVQIQLGSLTLPPIPHEKKCEIKTVSNWTELENLKLDKYSKDDFSGYGQAYGEESFEYINPEGKVLIDFEWFDFMVEVVSMEFGVIEADSIEFKTKLKFNFNEFMVHMPPFYDKGLTCDYFEITTKLKFGRIVFTNGAYNIKSDEQACNLAKYSIDLDLHYFNSETIESGIGGGKTEFIKCYSFYPNCTRKAE